MRNAIMQRIMPPPPNSTPPRLHPAAQEAAAAYSEALTKAAAMETELRALQTTADAQRQHISLLERQLTNCETQRQSLERFVVEIRTHFHTIMQVMATANEKAVTFAKTPIDSGPPATTLEKEIGSAAMENVQKEP